MDGRELELKFRKKALVSSAVKTYFKETKSKSQRTRAETCMWLKGKEGKGLSVWGFEVQLF